MRASIKAGVPLDDDFVFALSRAIPEYAFERDRDGGLLVAPNHTDGGRKSGEAYYQLRRWVERTGARGMTFDSSTGFRLGDSSLVSPDAAWLSDERVRALSIEDRMGYWRVCPEILIEVASASDRWSETCAKIDRYAACGAFFAAAVDPRTYAVYERGVAPDTIFDYRAIADA